MEGFILSTYADAIFYGLTCVGIILALGSIIDWIICEFQNKGERET